MIIANIERNNRKKTFSVTSSKSTFIYPFAKLDPLPTIDNPVDMIWIDDDFGGEAFSYKLRDGKSGTVHIDHILEYNREPNYMTELLLYKLTIEAKKYVEISPLSKREIIRNLGTSPSQYYRLLDQTNVTKSINKMLNLLQVLGCEMDIIFRDSDTKQESTLISV
ncbi:MAG: hypothetical protein PF693_16495 [Spirochaetia bacterium]|jgi:predicted XRE-type DNA-binding protein|nr:hypothetical protein [Spirochaetia bacterium]